MRRKMQTVASAPRFMYSSIMFFRRRNADDPGFATRVLGPTLGAVLMFVAEIVQIAVFALAIILPVRYFLIQPFIVKGASMEPNFYDSEYLIVDELTYRFREPVRGEIVVFRPPNHEDQYYIKRVIGLPGETVEVRSGKVTIFNDEYPNGATLQETYIDEVTQGKERVTVGADEYFLLGDNRDASLDSRYFGAVEKNMIIGRVWVRGLPLERASTFDVPTYRF